MQDSNQGDENVLYVLCGEALLWAQMLEQEILTGILLHAVVRGTVLSRDEANELLRRKDKQPLKHKLDEVFKRVGTKPDLTPVFYEALEKRNFFVHRFFWDRMELSFSYDGREKLVAEVEELRELFRSAYLFAKGITELYAKQTDLTAEMITEELKHVLPEELHNDFF